VTDQALMLRARAFAFLGTERANDEPSVDFEDRRHRCYELAAYAIAFGDAPRNSMLVHGSIFNHEHSTEHGRISHAWVAMPGGWVWEPITCLLYRSGEWSGFASPIAEYVYTRRAAQLRIMATMSYGPWERMKYR
jgi:hypothetical protein